MILSSAETTGAVSTSFNTVNLHRPASTRCFFAAGSLVHSSLRSELTTSKLVITAGAPFWYFISVSFSTLCGFSAPPNRAATNVPCSVSLFHISGML